MGLLKNGLDFHSPNLSVKIETVNMRLNPLTKVISRVNIGLIFEKKDASNAEIFK
jgi:hypothetical protein